MTRPAISALCDEFNAYCDQQGFPKDSGDAMDLMMGHELTREQFAWLKDFVDRWDAADEADPGFYAKQPVVEG